MSTQESRPWRTVIVDDEPLARDTLRLLLAREADFAIVGECRDGAGAIETLARTRPDVMFLDVQMPEVDGFAVLRALETSEAVVIFVSAFDQYALKAFEQHAFDYLLKPFSDERFAAVIARLRARLRERAQALTADRLSTLLSRTAVPERRSLVIRDGGRTIVVPHDDILWIEAEDYCARIYLRDRQMLVRESLRGLIQALPAGFVRVHRSAIANVGAIRSLEPLASGDQRLTLADGTTLKVSRTHRADVVAALQTRR